jgi:hypothetical protein
MFRNASKDNNVSFNLILLLDFKSIKNWPLINQTSFKLIDQLVTKAKKQSKLMHAETQKNFKGSTQFFAGWRTKIVAFM